LCDHPACGRFAHFPKGPGQGNRVFHNCGKTCANPWPSPDRHL
jgi:hypothetical protein